MMGDWTFFSNYGHVLVCLARNRESRLRDVAREVGVTERAVQKIVRDLQDAGFVEVTKQGRCNRYRINRRKSLRHSLESHCTVGKLLTLVAREERPDASAGAAQRDDRQAVDNPLAQEAPRATPSIAASLSADPVSAEAAAAPAESTGTVIPALDAGSVDASGPSKPGTEKDRKKEQSPAETRQQGNLF